MSWNPLMQSLHSALIDELNERHPKEKPELGLPRRFAAWGLAPQAEKAVVRAVEFPGANGFVTFGVLNSQKDADVVELMDAVIARAQKDFVRHGITPDFKNPQAGSAFLPAGFAEPACLIWLPISIAVKKDRFVFDLGVGI